MQRRCWTGCARMSTVGRGMRPEAGPLRWRWITTCSTRPSARCLSTAAINPCTKVGAGEDLPTHHMYVWLEGASIRNPDRHCRWQAGVPHDDHHHPTQSLRDWTDSPRSGRRPRPRDSRPVLGRWYLRQPALHPGVSRVGCLPHRTNERRHGIRSRPRGHEALGSPPRLGQLRSHHPYADDRSGNPAQTGWSARPSVLLVVPALWYLAATLQGDHGRRGGEGQTGASRRVGILPGSIVARRSGVGRRSIRPWCVGGVRAVQQVDRQAHGGSARPRSRREVRRPSTRRH